MTTSSSLYELSDTTKETIRASRGHKYAFLYGYALSELGGARSSLAWVTSRVGTDGFDVRQALDAAVDALELASARLEAIEKHFDALEER